MVFLNGRVIVEKKETGKRIGELFLLLLEGNCLLGQMIGSTVIGRSVL